MVMVYLRTFLASLIALAVAVAPVAAMVIAGSGVRTTDTAVTHHCHGKLAQSTAGHDATLPNHDQDKTSQQADKGGCQDCDGKRQAKCVGDGSKCCKLTGMVAVLPAVAEPPEDLDLATNPATLIGWQMRPSPPPPRA